MTIWASLLLNLWIWKILATNLFLGLLVVAATIILYHAQKGSGSTRKFLVLFGLVLVFQLQMTERTPLWYLDNDEQRVQQMRLGEYPPLHVQIGETTVWIPIGHWFEGRKESITFFRMSRNFSEAADPSLYFFSNHPRERVNVQEFEKFPYVFFPLFVIGFWQNRRSRTLLFSVLAPLLLVSLIGHKNPIGPFSLFPFLAATTAIGLGVLLEKLAQIPTKHRRKVGITFSILVILIFLQTIAYAKY